MGGTLLIKIFFVKPGNKLADTTSQLLQVSVYTQSEDGRTCELLKLFLDHRVVKDSYFLYFSVF